METSAAIASGTLSCVAAVETCLMRARATEPTVRAFLHLEDVGALGAAAERDRELSRGRRRSALHGIPVAIKDIVDVASMPTTAASRVMAPAVAGKDAEIVEALRAAGAVIIGKTNTHEFANGALTPPTRNPCDPGRIAGGSSGGSAAAVAAGSALLAVGTDTGGSARLPAALCGVAGFRPRRDTDRIGMGGVLPLAAEFDQWGLLARDARDVAFAFSALLGAEAPPAPIARLRLVTPARLPALLQGHDAAVMRCFDMAIDRFAAAGASVSTVELPDLARWRGPRMAIQMRQMLQAHRRAGWWPAARDRYTDEVRANLDYAERDEASPLAAVRAELEALDSAVDAALAQGALLASPTVAITAPMAEEVAKMPRGAGARHPIIGLLGQAVLPFSRPTLATITIPCGTASNLPVGLQLVGTDDHALLGAALAVGAALAAAPIPAMAS